MLKTILTILGILALLLIVLISYAACVMAGREDRAMEHSVQDQLAAIEEG